ncbi:MAG: hypothetical protein RR327_07090, partial [Clostridia bacterium]
MKKVSKVLSFLLVLALALSLFAGCAKDEKPDPTGGTVESLGVVKFGIHPGQSATQAGFVMQSREMYKKYNFTTEMTITTGPNVFAALAAGSMDIGYLGNGMAWHYFEPNSKIQILTIDNLTNDDRLIVKKGRGVSANETIENLYAKLPGMTLAADLTTTPGTFLRGLVNEMNKGKADADKVWYQSVDKAFPLKGAANKEIKIMNTTNANVTAVMEDPKVDCCISFGPPKVTLVKQTDKYDVAATTFTHLSDTVTPSTWAVNKEWSDKN